MSNLALTAAAQAYAEKHVLQFLKEYNGGELTDLGKRELLRDLPMFAFMAGYTASNPAQVLLKVRDLLYRMQDCYSNEDIDGGNLCLHGALEELEHHTPFDKFNLKLRDEYELPSSLMPEERSKDAAGGGNGHSQTPGVHVEE